MLTLTDSAVTAIKRFMSTPDQNANGLRIQVSGGGCSGFQYGLRLEQAAETEDEILDCNGVTVFVDPASAPMLSGVVVDFVDNIEGAGFKFENPNAKASCGCGNSFSC